MFMHMSERDVGRAWDVNLYELQLSAKHFTYIIPSGFILFRLNKDSEVQLGQMSCSGLHKS